MKDSACPCCKALALAAVRLLVHELGISAVPDELLGTFVDRAAAAQGSPPPPAAGLSGQQLQFVHACRFTACCEPACELCKNNPHKACTTQLRPKYVVHQEIAAPCGGHVRLTLAAAVQQQWDQLLGSGARLQLLLVDERLRQQQAKSLLLTGASSASTQQVAELLRECVVAFDPTGKPMLSCGAYEAQEDGSLLLPLGEEAGRGVVLAGLSVGCSTERATAGRKRAPVRLAALLVGAGGQPLDVAPALSPEFYVVSDRSENHEGMGATLFVDSPVGLVRTIGKETARRLHDLPAACGTVGVRLRLPEGLTSITTVRQLAQLLQATHTQSADLSQVLKISKGQLDAARAHAATAVEPDGWLRAYTAPNGTGLLYTCEQGECSWGDPAAAFEYRREASGELLPLAVERIAPGTPQLQQPGPLQQLVAAAQAAWAAPGHVGWAVLQLRGERFVSLVSFLKALPAEAIKPVVSQLPALSPQAVPLQQPEPPSPRVQRSPEFKEPARGRQKPQPKPQPKQARQRQRQRQQRAQPSTQQADAAAAEQEEEEEEEPLQQQQQNPPPSQEPSVLAPPQLELPEQEVPLLQQQQQQRELQRQREQPQKVQQQASPEAAPAIAAAPPAQLANAARAQLSHSPPPESVFVQALQAAARLEAGSTGTHNPSAAYNPFAVAASGGRTSSGGSENGKRQHSCTTSALQQQQGGKRQRQLPPSHSGEPARWGQSSEVVAAAAGGGLGLAHIVAGVPVGRVSLESHGQASYQQQQQQQQVSRPMPSVPRPYREPRPGLHDWQQAELLDLLKRLSKSQQQASAGGGGGVGGTSLIAPQTSLGLGVPGALGAPPGGSMDLSFWTSSLEALAAMFKADDQTIPVVPLPLPGSTQ